MKKLRIVFALLLVIGAAGLSHAQVLYGTLTGNVTDPSGALVPGAKVTALNTGTGVARETATDNRGSYQFTNLQLGTYKVTVHAASFQAVAEDKVQVSINEVRRVDFSLT